MSKKLHDLLWFYKQEEEFLQLTFHALKNHHHWNIQLLRFCFGREQFLLDICKIELVQNDPYNQIKNQLESKIKTEMLARQKSNNTQMNEFMKNILKQLFNYVDHATDDELSKASLLSGHFSKEHPLFPLSHSVVHGDDGGLYVLMNTIDEEERKLKNALKILQKKKVKKRNW